MSNFTKFPFVKLDGDFVVVNGWDKISDRILKSISKFGKKKNTIVIEYYPGVLEEETTSNLVSRINPDLVLLSKDS